MTPRRHRPSEAAVALVLAALLLVGCGGGETGGGEERTAADRPVAEELGDPAAGGGVETAGASGQLGPAPSDFARRTIPAPLLRLYLRSGSELNLDWWVIAAVDQIDLKSGDPGIPPRERVPGIGYSLAAAGAPHDNHAALAARAGGAYAERALALAARYVESPRERATDADDGGGERP